MVPSRLPAAPAAQHGSKMHDFGPFVLAILILAPAVVYDIRYRRIPNKLSLAGVVLGVILHAVLSGWSGAALALASAMALLFGMFVFFAIGWLGAGDVKLLAAAGAIGGTLGTALSIAFATVVLGALMGLVLTALGGQLRRLGGKLRDLLALGIITRRLPAYEAEKNMAVSTLPYAIPIAAGTLLGMAYTMGVFG
jgi:prepilin peptidase CpaA